MKFCAFSKRIYKNKLDLNIIIILEKIMHTYNCAVRKAYALKIAEEYKNIESDKSIHMTIKESFNLNDYFANSTVQQANTVYKSNIKLQPIYITQMKDRIFHAQKKLKELTAQVDHLSNMKLSLIKVTKALNSNKKIPKIKNYKGSKISTVKLNKDGILIAVHYKRKSDIYFSIWEFEYNYLVPKIRKIKNRIKHLAYGISIKETKLKQLQEKPYFSCFGSKSFFKKQYTIKKYRNNHSLWLKKFRTKRQKLMTISGRLDAAGGNFVFKYDTENHNLNFNSSDGTLINLGKVDFPYGQSFVDNAVTIVKNRKPVAWSIEDHDKYYIVKAIVELPSKELNYSKADGLLSLDINYDRIAWSNLDTVGNLLNHGIIYFNLLRKTTNQASKIIEEAAVRIEQLANKLNKPICIENLDTEKSKSFLQYGNKKRNFKIAAFAYKKITDAVTAGAYKQGIYVYRINPAYTSQIGKMKYMKKYSMSIHEAASYAIGRRGLRLKDLVPKQLKKFISDKLIKRHYWAHWSYLTRSFKNIPIYYFFNNYNTEKYDTLSTFTKVIKKSYEL